MLNRTIGEDEARQRVDLVLTKLLPDLSRAYIKKLILDGRVMVNQDAIKPGDRVKLGDNLQIDFDPKELERIEDIDLPVIYEDRDVIVINKPAGVISHARGKFWNEPSVASFVRQKTAQSGERAGIVHRLDRATSGVMICSKNQSALAWLQKQFADRSTAKQYLAVIKGAINPAEAVIDMPIGRNPKQPQIFRVDAAGKPSQTAYRSLKSVNGFTLLELTPKTGRTHQLRVHLKQMRHPIVGDTLYGGSPAVRLFLHAHSLELELPSGKSQRFIAPIPPEFDSLLGGKL